MRERYSLVQSMTVDGVRVSTVHRLYDDHYEVRQGESDPVIYPTRQLALDAHDDAANILMINKAAKALVLHARTPYIRRYTPSPMIKVIG